MKLNITSDLHLEFFRDKNNPFRPVSADVAIFAGDITTNRARARQFFDKFHDQDIIYVLGNHEFYGQDFEQALTDYGKVSLAKKNISMLECEERVISGVHFLGCTLWSDFAKSEKQKEFSGQTVSDYAVIVNQGELLTPDDTEQRYHKSLAWLEARLTALRGECVVVITHHAPSFRSNPPKFAGSLMSGAFCNNLDEFVGDLSPTLWIHGHIHDSQDYMINKTRVICNPYGYYRGEHDRSELNPKFDQELVIEI